MFDRIKLGRFVDAAVPAFLLVVAGVGVVYAITIATTLRDLRARESATFTGQPDLQVQRCPAVTGVPGAGSLGDGEPSPHGAAATPPPAAAADRSAGCTTPSRQMHAQ